MSHSRFTSLSAFALLGAAGAVACSDTSRAPSGVQSATLTLSAADSTAFAGALGDIGARIEPTLGNSPAVSALHTALAHVDAALAARDRAAIENALADGDAALSALADADASQQGNAPTAAVAPQELDVIRLVLLQVRAVLAPPASSPDAAKRP